MMKRSRSKTGSILYYVTALAAAIGLAVVGMLSITTAARAQASRLEENDKIEAAFEACIAPIRDQARRRVLTLPTSSTWSGDSITVSATVTDSSATVLNSARVDMVALHDGRSFHRTQYVGISQPLTSGSAPQVITDGFSWQKGYWPAWTSPYSYGGNSYTEPEGGPQEMPDMESILSTPNWSSATVNINPMGIEGFWSNFQGMITAPVTGSYTFTATSDDGVRVFIDGVNILNGWTVQAPTRYVSSAVSLTAGQQYEIRVEHFDYGGGSALTLNWYYTGQSETLVPVANLTPLGVFPSTSGDFFSYPVGVRSTYLQRISSWQAGAAPADAPLVVDLYSLGFAAGSKVNLSALGGADDGSGTMINSFSAVLASTPKYNVDDTQANRISNPVSPPSGTSSVVTTGNDISTDFWIPNASAGGITITLPSTARYLFVAPNDYYVYDNKPYQGKIFNIVIKPG